MIVTLRLKLTENKVKFLKFSIQGKVRDFSAIVNNSLQRWKENTTTKTIHVILKFSFDILAKQAGGGTGPADPAAAGPIQEHTVKNFFPSLSQRNKY